MRSTARACAAWLASLCLLVAHPAAAQERRPLTLDVSTGWAGFIDESAINHAVVSGGLRFSLTPRLSVGPEVTYTRGPGDDRDLFVLGNLFFDLLKANGRRPPPVSPFLVAGGGLFQFRNRYSGRSFTSSSPTFAGGAGVRVAIGDRISVAPEFRVGVEDVHIRAGVTVGIGLGR